MEVEYFSHNVVGRRSTVQLNAVYPLILHELYKLIRNQLWQKDKYHTTTVSHSYIHDTTLLHTKQTFTVHAQYKLTKKST